MDKNDIKEKLKVQKNANLINTFEIGSKQYAKAILNFKNGNFNIIYKYYEILDNNIKELSEEEQERVKVFFEKKYGNIVY